jgi:hypothetical protein
MSKNTQIVSYERVALIEKSFEINNSSRKYERRYQVAAREKDKNLLHNNHLFLEVDKKQFSLGAKQIIYEVRNCPNRGLVEFEYISSSEALRDGFMREGCITEDSVTYKMAFHPDN